MILFYVIYFVTTCDSDNFYLPFHKITSHISIRIYYWHGGKSTFEFISITFFLVFFVYCFILADSSQCFRCIPCKTVLIFCVSFGMILCSNVGRGLSKIKKKERVFTQVLYSTAISLGRAGQWWQPLMFLLHHITPYHHFYCSLLSLPSPI